MPREGPVLPFPNATPQLKHVVDAEKRVTDLREAAKGLLELLDNAKPGDRHWHAKVRARVVEILRLYPVREARR